MTFPTLRQRPTRYIVEDFFEALQALNLDTNCKLCLDVGDSASYNGTGQTWADLSGNGMDFNRGASSSAESSDPTFNGSSGGLSSAEYWSFDDVNDRFTEAAASPSWVDNLHKAGAQWTMAWWIYLSSSDSDNEVVFSNSSFAVPSTGIGISCDNRAGDRKVRLRVYNASGSYVYDDGGSEAPRIDGWNFAAISVDEGTKIFQYLNGVASDGPSPSYTSPSSSAASNSIAIGASAAGGQYFSVNCRFAGLAIWEGRVLTEAELDAIYNRTRGRFGI